MEEREMVQAKTNYDERVDVAPELPALVKVIDRIATLAGRLGILACHLEEANDKLLGVMPSKANPTPEEDEEDHSIIARLNGCLAGCEHKAKRISDSVQDYEEAVGRED